jgi:hypothetical protein
MKKNTLTLTLALVICSIFSTIVHGQVMITGSGKAYSQTPPDCDENSKVEAKAAADQDAIRQCQGIVIRISEYTLKCNILVHGYAASAQVIATYECKQ